MISTNDRQSFYIRKGMQEHIFNAGVLTNQIRGFVVFLISVQKCTFLG